MKIEKLIELKDSREAPFNHETYTVWLHNKILQEITHEIEELAGDYAGHYLLDKVLNLPSLQTIK